MTAAAATPLHLVVMGVSGCGKTLIGRAVARALSLEFIEGDELHSPRNVALMAAGTPLTDADRADWLATIAARLGSAQAAGQGLVVSCSALKRSYRDTLRRGARGLQLVHLAGTPALLAARTAHRPGHYMPASLLASQFATLEPPGADEHALTFDVVQPPSSIVNAVCAAISSQARPN